MDKKVYIDSDGFRLNCLVEGKGLAVLIPGSTVYYPRVFSEELKQHLQLIHMDHRGFVPPPEDADIGDYTLDKLVEDIERCRKHLGLEHFHIMGHSGHAFMALEYAKKYPEHVDGVIMIGVTPDYSDATHRAADQFFEKEASAERKEILEREMAALPARIEANPDKRFVAYCLAAGAKSWYDMHFDASPLWEDMYTNMPMIDHVWGHIFRDIDITKDLRELNRPVLIALGRYDFLTGPVHLWNKVLPFFRHPTVQVFDKSAHCPQYEEPELFDRILLEWINENKVTRYY